MFSFENTTYNNNFSTINNLPTQRNYITEIDKEYFVLRENEYAATALISLNTFSKPFIEAAKKYFSDCKDILKYLEHDLYDEQNVIELIEDYNLLCE